MEAEKLFSAGRLEEAIAAQLGAVKAAPTDTDRRYFLFGLLAFTGDWERAGRQLDALGVQDEAIAAGGRVYRLLLDAELERRAVWEQGKAPLSAPDPPAHLESRLALVAALAAGDLAAAEAAQAAAVAAAPGLRGSINGQPLRGLRDQDDVLGSLIEVFAGGRCLWLPLEHLRSLTCAPPRHLLDLIWLPAQLCDASGVEANVHLPALYAGSGRAADDGLRLGRGTDWVDQGAAIWRGVGQRLLAYADGEEALQTLGLLELRSLSLEAV